MKRVYAILLTSVFMFNLFGYRLLFNYMQQQSDIRLTASLDNDRYNEADLISIQVPLSLPYMNDQKDFERVNGEITVNGKILKYVKRKISNGNLVLMCLADDNKMRLASAKTEFFKIANDLVQNNQPKKPGGAKSVVIKNLSEYDAFNTAYTSFSSQLRHTHNSKSPLSFLPSSHQALPEQPPERI